MNQSTIPTTFRYEAKRGRKKRRRDEDKCLVCEGQSVGINFGVHTCSPCKAFFRRNALKLGVQEFRCNKDGDCTITHNTRRVCNCCRLAKCFRVGMDRNAIRTEDQRLERNRLIECNRRKRAESNLTIQPVNLNKYSSRPTSSLLLNDQSLLTNIFRAYNQTCISLRFDEHVKMPNDNSLSLQQFMNSMSHMYISFVDYFKFIPEFKSLPVETRITLLKSNFNQLFRLNSVLVVHATGAVQDTNSLGMKNLFPDHLYVEMCCTLINLFPFVYDPIFLKLLFIILIFSTSLCTRYNVNENLVNTKELLSIQNVYIELLWRYMLYRHSTAKRSIRILTSFVTGLLRSQRVTEELTEFVSKSMSNQVDQLEPIMRAMWLMEKK